MLSEFVKQAPEGFAPAARCAFSHDYKYFLSGKGSTLGILFEDSSHVYFEWILEDGCPVAYGPEVRYRAWTKRDFCRLISRGVWEPSCTPA